MICTFVGLPGAGKTTVLTSLALKFSQPYSKYHHVYHNVKSLSVPGATYIDNECIGKYQIAHSLVLIDEGQLFADNRDYSSFPKYLKEFFFMHRHYKVDVFLFTQQWDGLDKKIRSITDRVYYIYKTPILGIWFSTYYKIPYDIIIPDPKSGSSKLGEIIQGYCKPNLLVRIFAHRLYRPNYYKYFDSFEIYSDLPSLPERYEQTPWTVPQLRKMAVIDKKDEIVKRIYIRFVKPIKKVFKKTVKRVKKTFGIRSKKAA